jgi:hypothetical protein
VILLTALGTVLLTSEALGVFVGSSLLAQFFFSVNKCQKFKQCEEPAQYKSSVQSAGQKQVKAQCV